MIKQICYTFCIALGLLLAGCGDDSSNAPDKCSALGLSAKPAGTTATNADINEKIANGTPCTDLNKSPVVAVVVDFADGSSGLCTGSMISANKVLTAAHCMAGASNIDVFYGATTDKFSYNTASSWSVHPEYKGLSADADSNDIGIVHLSRSLSLPTLPILVSSPAQVGQAATIFGYGVTAGGAKDSGQLRSGAMTVAAVDAEHIYAQYVEGSSNTCTGDSGGPFLLQVGGQMAIAGTTSFGNSSKCAVGEWSGYMYLQSPSNQNFLRNTAPDARFY